MQIVKLELQGIGPFTDHHVIDFREIGQSGLFLLDGPTGSGKTTILDAIVFALYGDVAGADSSKGRIVSTMLCPGREPFVDLMIDSSRGLLRVRRTPEFERPKLRGQGTTTSKATLKLWKLSSCDDPEGTPVSTNVAEASEELQRAIRLTKEQFTQTVLLPQGHFATFLRAKPEDRRDVLQDIFGTHFYERFAKQLSDMAQEHRSRMDRAQNSVMDVAATFCRLAWYDDAAAASVPIPEQLAFDRAAQALDLDGLRDGVRLRSLALNVQLASVRERAEATRAEHLAAAENLRRIQTRNQLINEVTALNRSREDLRLREADVERDRTRLADAERAEHARRPITNSCQAVSSLAEAREAMLAGVDSVQAGRDADLASGQLSTERLRALEGSVRLEASTLAQYVALEKGLPARAEGLARERQSQVAERSRLDEVLQRVADSRIEAVELGERLGARGEVAGTLASAVENQAAAERRRQAAREAARLATLLATARAAELVAAQGHVESVERHREARNAWLNSLAGELAVELVDGRPCAVCGSETHPHPATRPDGFVGRDEVQALAEAMEEASRKAAGATGLCDRIAGQIEQQTGLSEGLSLSEAESLHAEAKESRQLADRATRDVVELRTQIKAMTEAADKDERSMREAEHELATRVGRLEEAERLLAADRAEVTAHSEDFTSVLDRRSALISRADTAKELSTLLEKVGTAQAESERCMSELQLVLAERGFATIDEAQRAMLPDLERTRLAAELQAYTEEVAGVDAQLANERFTGLAGATPEDPAPACRAEQKADAAQREAHRLSGATEATVRATAAASEDLTKKIAALSELRGEAGPLLRMANLANAGEGNLQRVSLPTYVLLRRFEEVVDLANLRLDAMTGGRYELRRTDEREGRSRKLGLGLEVVDHQARDTRRDPQTLSGGETFMASLSLALGLADAVTAEAGGIQLHTLFVDEGFGSLDPETLDAVMQQLSALRAGGRTVGVVSHVAELKQRIAERITVVPRRDGTSTLRCSTNAQPAAGR